ncbi:AraC family transcriptional regulator, arabinose operon regulatory protein [Cohnella sp. OV330]|uniref:helix-turn-helix domain-containing protein n=1 Tax=Cohnella sp. OV330 TaxID=1855288 RepID=UPI0008E3DDD7|nr:AraC family transcriptional regulator [Cohnella sp. OV330]SFB44082.1 AraC family transcriptional regulator, arabinose operon regulatory protein [Cohnella sp. OV330]
MTSGMPDFSFDRLTHAVAGSIVYPPGSRFGPRVQQDIQLVMLYSGEMTVTLPDRQLRVKPGHVILLKPGFEETFFFSKSEDTWHRWIAVHFEDLPAAAVEALDGLPECLPLSEEMNLLTDLMIRLNRQGSETDADVRSLGLAAMHLYPRESAKAMLQREKHPAVYAALAMIHDHYAEEMSLNQLASAAGSSPEHLVRLFKKHERASPIQYLWQYRVNRAVELLTYTGLTVSEISLRCGFKTSHHLARLVKETTGRTATDIRRTSWNGSRDDNRT